MFLPGFKWCEDGRGAPVLAWFESKETGFAFVQKGDGSVTVHHTPILLSQAGDKVDPRDVVQVPDVMLAWAKRIMGGETRMTLGYATGMVVSGVTPDGFFPDPPAVSSPAPPQCTPPRAGPKVLGPGSWSI